MRPVNLIPPESRRGSRAPLRAGSLSYVLVGGLAVALLAVTGLVLTGNKVSEREDQLAVVEAEKTNAEAQAQALAPYAEFATLREQRQATIDGLAKSRFDWERVMRELALIIPSDIWLVQVAGTASPEANVDGVEDSLRDSAAGPALSLVGCGASQDSVAGFAAALEDIDGVTRVGIAKSERLLGEVTGGSSADDCRTRDFIARFEITAAFDEVPAPGTVPPTGTDPAPTGDDGGVAQATASEQAATDSAATQSDKSKDAASNLIPGTAR